MRIIALPQLHQHRTRNMNTLPCVADGPIDGGDNDPCLGRIIDR